MADPDPGTIVESPYPAAKPVARRVLRIVVWLAGIALALFVLDELGVPISDWINKFLDELRSVPAWAIVGGIVLDTVQTVFAALAWLTILRAAFPNATIGVRPVVAAYAVAVGLNGFLPANIGTLVMMLMFVSLIAGATFAAIFSGFVIQKIPFTVFTLSADVYLFLSVGSSFGFEFGFFSKHPGLTVIIVLGSLVLIAMLVRIYWRRAAKLRGRLKEGGAVLRQPRRFIVGVVVPSTISYLARLAIVAVFLAAFSIPVTGHSVVAVSAANSLSSSLSVTPGGVGVTQALNVVVLQDVTSRANATAYSVAQQLVISAWDVVFAIILVAWVFGWSGGKELVRQSYAAAEVKKDELKEEREAKRQAKREARRASGRHAWRRRD